MSAGSTSRRSRLIDAVCLAAAGVLTALPSVVSAQQTPQPTAEDRPLTDVLEQEIIRDLPLADSLFSLLETTQPTLISERFSNAGLYPGQPARIGGYMTSWSQTLFRVGSVDIGDAAEVGFPLLVPSLDPWQRVRIATGLMSADVNATGYAVSLEPQRPGRAWTTRFSAETSHGGLAGSARSSGPPSIARLDSFDHGAFLASGPIVADRVGGVFAVNWTKGSQFNRQEPEAVDSQSGSAFAHLVFTPRERDEFRVLGWFQKAKTPFAHRLAFQQPDAKTDDTAAHTQVAFERQSGAWPWQIVGSYTRRTRSPERSTGATVVFERLLDGPLSQLSSVGHETAGRWSVGVALGEQPDAAGGAAASPDKRHRLRFGAEVGGTRLETSDFFTGIAGETVDGLSARLWRFDAPPGASVRSSLTTSAYAIDRMTLGPDLEIEAGLRLEGVSASARGSADDIGWWTLLPRAMIRWKAVFGGYSRSAYRLPLNVLGVGDPSAPTASVFRWDGGAAELESGVPLGPLVRLEGPGTAGDPSFIRIDPDFSRPVTDEFVVGVEGRPREDMLLRLIGVARRESPPIGLVNFGVDASGYATFGILDQNVDWDGSGDDQTLTIYDRLPASFGLDRYLLTNPDIKAATGYGLEFSIRWTRDRLWFSGGATASIGEGSAASTGFTAIENDHGVLGELFTNPNAASSARGRLFSDRAYTIKLMGVYRFPYDIRLGAIARYQDGQPFARVVVVPELGQGVEAVRAVRNGDHRFTFTGTFDARLQKGFAVGGGRIEAVFDVYNLFDLSYEVEERIVTGNAFRQISAVQPPRSFALGVRVAF
jgi:hypothetical protein